MVIDTTKKYLLNALDMHDGDYDFQFPDPYAGVICAAKNSTPSYNEVCDALNNVSGYLHYDVGGYVPNENNPMFNKPVFNKPEKKKEKPMDAKKKTVDEFFAVDKIIWNDEGRTTIVNWKDGTKTVVRCMEGEAPDKFAGFAAAVMKKLYGSSGKAKNVIADHDVAAIAEEQKKKLAEEKRAKEEDRKRRFEKAKRKRYRRMVRKDLEELRISSETEMAFKEAYGIYTAEKKAAK